MTYDEAMAYIHGIDWRGSKPGLSRTRALLAAVGDPQDELKFIHVAGTNGKGSFSAMTESILRRAGYRTGLFTSPFITRFNERIRVGGEDIPDGALAALVEEIRPLAEGLDDPPTEFELITAIGMLWFARNACDIVVLEVGLGGELDSTNVIDVPELAVIMALGLDHTEILGPTMADIARAKAGIIKAGGDVLSYGGEAEADRVVEETCRARGARLRRPDFAALTEREAALTGRIFDYGAHKELCIPLAGRYQLKNAAMAVEAAELLRGKGWRISDDAIREGLAATVWKGRFELLRREPPFILDGSHNPQGVAAAAETLREFFPEGKIVFLTGVMADKDVDVMIAELLPLASCFVTVRPENRRALAPERYAERIRAAGGTARAADSIDAGAALAAELAGRDGVVCAIGSLYMSEDVREAFLKMCNKKDK